MAKKITKIIAALGVVAGLGVAALPLSSYADDVEVQVEITATTGTVEPTCEDGESGSTVAAGVDAESDCTIGGSSNTGIAISIANSQTNANGTSTALTGYTLDFEGRTDAEPTNATNGSIIPAIAAQMTDGNFNVGNITSINGGLGGWGYNFITGGTIGLSVNTTAVGGTATASAWNPITNSNVLVASSSAATVMSGAKFNFRAVTPPSQPAGFYSNVVIVTIATNP
ncbi:hypothetical protein FWF89_01330 [Candidatus Saccharibacteria bacterium]|nr:hypothetical protein [Candidatus Saccharibacteria bacterium]